MKSGARISPSFVHLDMARGVAALLVLSAHLRQLVFCSYGDLSSHGPLEMLVWGISGFGYQAVMIFFVLSGFFIARSILIDDQSGKFSWRAYLTKRLTRLWVVLIPCLIATLLWDSLDIELTGRAFGADDLGPLAFFKNLLFLVHGETGLSVDFFGYTGVLQDIAAPTYGSNGPLWSLTNEFWYYMMFPLIYFSIRRPGTWPVSATFLGMFIVGLAFVGESIGVYGLVWLAGAVSYMVYHWGRKVTGFRTSFAVTATGALLTALAASKMPYGTELTKNMLIGLAGAPFVLALARSKAGGELYRRSARVLANASYTIYLAHFPFLVLLANVFIGDRHFSNSPAGYAAFVGVGSAVLVYCFAMYWLFERHTGKVRDYCLARFCKGTLKDVEAMPKKVDFA
jgi:peptidoglycan/LPS O-acetylase OafA/YrhL